FAWFAEVTTGDWEVGQRWPESGVLRVDPAGLAVREQPAAAGAVDIGPLLAARARSLSVSLNGGPDLRGWTPVVGDGFGAAGKRLAELGLPGEARLRARLRDAASGEAAVLKPAKAWRRGEDLAWSGEALGVEWVLVADGPRAGELRLTG